MRYCRSDFCYEVHKQPQSEGVRSRCDLIKYCDRCCRQYRAKWMGDKLSPHKCSPSKCAHCSDVLIDEGHPSCYIQPGRLDEHSEKYIYFDFETMQENGKHTANYVCAISQTGEEFTAEGVDSVDLMVKYFICGLYIYCTQFFRFRFLGDWDWHQKLYSKDVDSFICTIRRLNRDTLTATVSCL